MLAADKTLTVGLVVTAKGGSSIRQWKKGDKFYDGAVRHTQQAMKKGELAGVLWHLGESDQNDADYLAKLKKLIANLTCMDRWHFDAKSMKTLGERYADAILNLRKNSGGAGRMLQPAGAR